MGSTCYRRSSQVIFARIARQHSYSSSSPRLPCGYRYASCNAAFLPSLTRTCTDFVDPQERIKELSQLIAALPLANYSLLRALTAHLILIVQNSSINKMTMRNVGIVFSPTLGIPAGVFSLMLGEFNRVFNVDADNEDAGSYQGEGGGADGLSDRRSAMSRRNSRQYSDGAADQLLGLSGRTLSSWFFHSYECLGC